MQKREEAGCSEQRTRWEEKRGGATTTTRKRARDEDAEERATLAH